MPPSTDLQPQVPLSEGTKSRIGLRQKAISWRKVILTAALLGLGANGLIQVGLQRDMKEKTAILSQQVQEAQGQSANMKNSLNGLSAVTNSSVHMASTLQQLDSATSRMNDGLALLEKIVQNIGSATEALGTSTHASRQEIDAALASATDLYAALQDVSSTNSAVIGHLGQMIAYQAAINQNLKDMNQKLALVP